MNKTFAPFYVGQQVVAIQTGEMITEGQSYTVSIVEWTGWRWLVALKEFPTSTLKGVTIATRLDPTLKHLWKHSAHPFLHERFRALLYDFEKVSFSEVLELEVAGSN